MTIQELLHRIYEFSPERIRGHQYHRPLVTMFCSDGSGWLIAQLAWIPVRHKGENMLKSVMSAVDLKAGFDNLDELMEILDGKREAKWLRPDETG